MRVVIDLRWSEGQVVGASEVDVKIVLSEEEQQKEQVAIALSGAATFAVVQTRIPGCLDVLGCCYWHANAFAAGVLALGPQLRNRWVWPYQKLDYSICVPNLHPSCQHFVCLVPE